MKALILFLLPACLAAQGLRVRAVESGGPVHVTGSRTSSPLMVEVTDENGAPVPGATVSFVLPPSGPGGTFPNGLTTDVVVAGADGRAAASSVRWSQTPGAFEIRVTASNGGLRASMVSPRRLLPPADGMPAAESSGRRRLILLVAGAAAGSVAAGLAVGRRSSGAGSPPAGQTVSIGVPVITVGGPG